MALAGGLVAAYACSQFFGLDFFVPSSVYTFNSDGAKIVRVGSSIGHADHLGNFLLYTTPLSLGLAFASRGGARLVAFVATLLSIAAIACSGTRGAWLGIIVGMGAMALLEFRAETAKRILTNKRQLTRVIAVVCVLLAATVLIGFSPSSRSIIERAKLMMTEGASSSGRLLLWRDSVKMIPRFAIVGCGPEGFRKAFPVYKSEELAQISAKIAPFTAVFGMLSALAWQPGLLFVGAASLAFSRYLTSWRDKKTLKMLVNVLLKMFLRRSRSFRRYF